MYSTILEVSLITNIFYIRGTGFCSECMEDQAIVDTRKNVLMWWKGLISSPSLFFIVRRLLPVQSSGRVCMVFSRLISTSMLQIVLNS